MDNRITIREALTEALVKNEKLDPADTIEVLRASVVRLRMILGDHGIDNLIDPNDARTIAEQQLALFLI